VFVGAGGCGLQIVRISDPARTVGVSAYGGEHAVGAVSVAGQYATPSLPWPQVDLDASQGISAPTDGSKLGGTVGNAPDAPQRGRKRHGPG
jgi:hypothetical protein